MDAPSNESNLIKIELAEATNLIESQVDPTEFVRESERLSALDPSALKTELTKLNNDIPLYAKEGKTDKVGLALKLLRHFNKQPNVRIYLHYFVQSETQESKDPKDTSLMQKVMDKIAKAFKIADTVDKESKKLNTT